jgi:2-amino-4-hydroxy-6-hydroxymethyldihydropteridine diphosphokinase
LGSNLGDRLAHLDAALVLLDRADGLQMLDCSPVIETPPFGPPGQRHYLNAVCVVACRRTPLALLRLLRRIECSRGRDRVNGQRWGPRTLDLDLLLYADRIIDHPLLTVPHPRLHLRRFVLEPLSLVAPQWQVPTLRKTVQQLLEQLPAGSSVDPSGTPGIGL